MTVLIVSDKHVRAINFSWVTFPSRTEMSEFDEHLGLTATVGQESLRNKEKYV